MYTDSFINTLIRCEKQITVAPRKEYKVDRGHLKKNFTMQSTDGKYTFNVFIRASTHFIENFSIGLNYKPLQERGSICLLRCNGAHGESIAFPHHSDFHIHKASAEKINNGLRAESNIEITSEYASLEEAIQFFCRTVNINKTDRREFFPEPDSQIEIDFNNE